MIAAELARDGAQLQAVMGYIDGLDFVAARIDARPYDMAVLAAFLVRLKHHGPRLADKFKAALGARYQVEILFAGEGALGRVGIERKAVVVILLLFLWRVPPQPIQRTRRRDPARRRRARRQFQQARCRTSSSGGPQAAARRRVDCP